MAKVEPHSRGCAGHGIGRTTFLVVPAKARTNASSDGCLRARRVGAAGCFAYSACVNTGPRFRGDDKVLLHSYSPTTTDGLAALALTLARLARLPLAPGA